MHQNMAQECEYEGLQFGCCALYPSSLFCVLLSNPFDRPIQTQSIRAQSVRAKEEKQRVDDQLLLFSFIQTKDRGQGIAKGRHTW